MSDKRETSDFYPNVRDGIITPSNAETWVEQFEHHAKAALASEENAAKSADAASSSATSAALYAQASSAGANAANESAETAKEAAAQAASRAEFALAAKTEAQSAAAQAASSSTAAAQSAQAAAADVTALLQGKVDAAEAAKAGAEAAKTAAETSKAGADAAKAEAASSATAAANRAAAAKQSATEAASQVTDTLKRINFCNGKFYSQYYNASSRSITWNEKIGDACLMAWNDRYIIITNSKNVGWIVVNGSDFSFISSSPYHHSAHLYTHSTFNCLGFNGSRVAIFYRFDEYKEGSTNCNYAEVLDANTGEVLIEKTYTAEEMAAIKAAPCFNLGFTCILKNGDMIHRGTIFSGEDLSIKGYVASEEGFAVAGGTYSTYCCYLTANADNSYSGEDPIIVQSNDTYSFWVDDRYTLGDDGNPIVTLRNFHVDGIFSETNSNTRKVAVLFSVYSKGWGNIYHVAAVRNHSTGKISIYNVSLDSTNGNIIAFSSGYEIDYVQNISDLVPVNFWTGGLIYSKVPFYVVRGALVYAAKGRSIASAPCIALQSYNNNTRSGGPYYTASVAYTKGSHMRPIPVSRFFYNNSSLIYPVENI